MPETILDTWADTLSFLDIHYHANPDTFVRRLGPIETGRRYAALGGAVILKNHLGGCSQMASVAASQGLPVLGSLVLNPMAGGVSLRAVQQELCFRNCQSEGRLIVHLPTQVLHKHKSVLKRDYRNTSIEDYSLNAEPLCLPDGSPRPELRELMDFAETAPIIVSSGHANRCEVEMLIELAGNRKTPVRLMLNQPANPMTGMSAKDLIALGAPEWLFIEQTALTVLLGYQSKDDFYSTLSDVPNLIYSSDLGQTSQMSPDEWRRWSVVHFDEAGLSEARRRQIELTTPLRMLAHGPLSVRTKDKDIDHE